MLISFMLIKKECNELTIHHGNLQVLMTEIYNIVNGVAYELSL